MWLAPEKNACFIAVANVSGGETDAACDEAVWAMIQKWLPGN
jgi:hypothetical protein